MDVARPKHPIASLRAFLTEMFTVTCGIVIALALDGLLQVHRNHVLRDQALQDFRAEVAANRARLATILAHAPDEGTMITGLLGYAGARLAHRPAPPPDLATIDRSFTFLANDAWPTALATTTIAQLGFPQVRALATLHAGLGVFNDYETRARDQWIGLSAFSDPTQLNDAELRAGLATLRIAYAYQQSLVALSRDLVKEADAASSALGK